MIKIIAQYLVNKEVPRFTDLEMLVFVGLIMQYTDHVSIIF